MAKSANFLQLPIDFFNAEERVEDLSVQDSLGVLCRLIAHEAVDERIGSRLNQNSCEGTIEEVRLRCTRSV